MLGEEESKFAEQKEKLDKLLMEIQQLCKELELKYDQLTAHSEEGTLLQVEHKLLKLYKDLLQQKAVRMAKFNQINEKVKEISIEFDEAPFQIEFNGIPNDSQVSSPGLLIFPSSDCTVMVCLSGLTVKFFICI